MPHEPEITHHDNLIILLSENLHRLITRTPKIIIVRIIKMEIFIIILNTWILSG